MIKNKFKKKENYTQTVIFCKYDVQTLRKFVGNKMWMYAERCENKIIPSEYANIKNYRGRKF